MPYKNHEDKLENNRLWYRLKQISKFRILGLEPLDLNDPRSDLRCIWCNKVTGRSSKHKYRHEIWCILNNHDYKVKPFKEGLSELEIEQRRINVKKIADSRRGKSDFQNRKNGRFA